MGVLSSTLHVQKLRHSFELGCLNSLHLPLSAAISLHLPSPASITVLPHHQCTDDVQCSPTTPWVEQYHMDFSSDCLKDRRGSSVWHQWLLPLWKWHLSFGQQPWETLFGMSPCFLFPKMYLAESKIGNRPTKVTSSLSVAPCYSLTQLGLKYLLSDAYMETNIDIFLRRSLMFKVLNLHMDGILYLLSTFCELIMTPYFR